MKTRIEHHDHLIHHWLAIVVASVCIALPLQAATPDLADSDVTAAIESELLVRAAVPSHRIDVDTSDGIVTLSGSVDNILARDGAIATAKSVKGVRAVVSDIDIASTSRTDDAIKSDVQLALAMDPVTDSYEVDVAVDDANVTLNGTVDSNPERALCARVAKGVKGVRGLTNKISVDYKSARTDSEIKPEVEGLLHADTRVDAYGINVAVDKGIVTLSGHVGSAAERMDARSTAWVAGVTAVSVDDLEIKWWAEDDMRRDRSYLDISDADAASAVEDALAHDPRVWSFDVDVDVNSGVAKLTGTVDNLRAKRAAESDARNTIGVWSVRNYLRVRPEPVVADSDITDRVQAALTRDPYVDRHELNVSSMNGKVYMYGTVDSAFERDHAEYVTESVNGVVDVYNGIATRTEWPWKGDDEVANDIRDQLYWSPFVDRDEVTVTVENGIATLSGTVDTWREYRAAARNAKDGGARTVHNELTVE